MSDSTLEAIRKHREVAKRIARGFYKKLPKNVRLEDIEQAALIGLWDWKRRYPDETAHGWRWGMMCRIRGSIIDELRAQDWLPRRARAEVNVKPVSIIRFDEASEFRSVHGDSCWEERLAAHDMPVDERLIIEEEAREALRAPLHARDRVVVDMIVRRGMRFQDVADHLGVSEPRVSQVYARSMRTMHSHLTGELPEATPTELTNGTAIPRHARRTIREHHANQANRTANAAHPRADRRHPVDPHPPRIRAGGLGSATPQDAARPVPRRSGVYAVGARARAELRAGAAEGSAAVIATLPEEGVDLTGELARYQAWMIDQALIRSNGNKSQAAKLLGLKRTTLVEMLKSAKRAQPHLALARPEGPPMKQSTGTPEPEQAASVGYQQINEKGLQTVPRVEIARLRGEGLTPKQIAAKLQCNFFLVERELRRMAPLAKCGER